MRKALMIVRVSSSFRFIGSSDSGWSYMIDFLSITNRFFDPGVEHTLNECDWTRLHYPRFEIDVEREIRFSTPFSLTLVFG